MPDISQYQNVFRIAKPNVSKRGQNNGVKRKSPAGSVPSNEKNDTPSDDDNNISKAQARLQKLEEMVTMLMQSNQNAAAAAQDVQFTPISTSAANLEQSSALKSIPPALKAVASSDDTPPEETPDLVSNGYLDVRGAESKYLGPTHWAAVLENVCQRPRPASNHLI
jgi:hypothetical protein